MHKETCQLNLFLHILPRNTKKAFLECSRLAIFEKFHWYLAGGTALALQVGHRQSVDLDFFTQKIKFQERNLERQLLTTNKWKTAFLEEGTVFGTFLKAKMSFIAYPFFVPSKKRCVYRKLNILLPHDIAAMKIIAISQRGKKRDFVDLYWYCQNREPLWDIVEKAIRHYPGQENNMNHILRSLEYFEDAESDPMPKIFFKASWPEIKRFFKYEVVKAAKKLLRLK